FNHAIAAITRRSVVTHKTFQGAVAADAKFHSVIAACIVSGDGQTIFAVSHIDDTGADTSFGVVNGIANAGK
ncbi:hypothetical protein AAIH02_34170, partial [Pseudomonas aeruginosa]